MSHKPTLGFCAKCGHHRLFEAAEINHSIHLARSIFTCGLWLISWVWIALWKRLRPWRCHRCGWAKPVFPKS